MSGTPSLALRSLLARPSRTLFTTFGIVLGVAVILAISITNLSTLESITTLFNEASGKADLVIVSSNTSSQGFSEDDLIDFTPELRQQALEIASNFRLGPLFNPPSIKRPP